MNLQELIKTHPLFRHLTSAKADEAFELAEAIAAEMDCVQSVDESYFWDCMSPYDSSTQRDITPSRGSLYEIIPRDDMAIVGKRTFIRLSALKKAGEEIYNKQN